MSVLIKGMEMPKTCASCDWSYYVGNGRAMCKSVSMTDRTDIMTKRRADFCPLVEIPTPHWIPVTERLPEDSVYVLLTVRRMDDSYNHVPFISTGYISWNHQCWWCAHDGNCKDANIDVLAWMPLPEPYKGVTE